MNYRPFLLVWFFLKSVALFAAPADTIKIFYTINKFDLSDQDKIKLKTMADTLKSTDTVKINSWTDYLGEDDLNLILSKHRAETIKNYMLSVNKHLLIVAQGRGPVHAYSAFSPQGEPYNRRTDIKVFRPGSKNTDNNQPHTVVRVLTRTVPPPAAKKPEPYIPRSEDRRPFEKRINDLANVSVGSSISLQEITFQPGRHVINTECIPYVDTLMRYLKKHVNLTFQIQGHICCVYNEGDSYDYDSRADGLSTNRAKVIYDYFLKNGISAKRMSYIGLGSSKPRVWPEQSEHDRYLNRRVEILITGK